MNSKEQEMNQRELNLCPICTNQYLAIRTDIYKDKREFVYCDCCGAMATKPMWQAAQAQQPTCKPALQVEQETTAQEPDGAHLQDLEDYSYALLAILERAGEGATVASVLDIVDAAQAQQPAQATTAQEPTVDEAIDQLVGALKRSKGWLGDYADAIIRDAIDRKHLGDETAQEPVAEWVKRPGLEDYPVLEFKEGYECEIGHKLFLHPAPQRKPLTPMQLAEIENRHNWQTTAGRFAIYREIEATKGQT